MDAADDISIVDIAPPKIKINIDVLGRRNDGYHELCSLVAFAADAGDVLTFEPGVNLSLDVDGPEASALTGKNLVLLGAEGLASLEPSLRLGRLRLTKHLPVAAGIGGGSADAAAAIRAIARANAIDSSSPKIQALAAAIGADVPVCIGQGGWRSPPHNTEYWGPEGAFMTGAGEVVWRPADRPLLPNGLAAVLVNPRVPVATGPVFQKLAAPLLQRRPALEPLPTFIQLNDCLKFIAASRNDLQAAAIAVAPVIDEVLALLRDLPESHLARMSGSGATCFALFTDIAAARRAAQIVQTQYPAWWCVATRLV